MSADDETKSTMGPPVLPQMNLFKRLRSLQNEKEALLQEHHISLETLEDDKLKVVDLLNTEGQLLRDVHESLEEATTMREEEESHKLKLKNDVIVVGQLRQSLGMLSASSKSQDQQLVDLQKRVTNVMQKIKTTKDEHKSAFYEIENIKQSIPALQQKVKDTKQEYGYKMENEQQLKNDVTQKQTAIKLKKEELATVKEDCASMDRTLKEMKGTRDFLEVEREKHQCKIDSAASLVEGLKEESMAHDKALLSILEKVDTEMTIKHKLFRKSCLNLATRLEATNKKMVSREKQMKSMQDQIENAKKALKDAQHTEMEVQKNHDHHEEQLHHVRTKNDEMRGELSLLQSDLHRVQVNQHDAIQQLEQLNEKLASDFDKLQNEEASKKHQQEELVKQIDLLKDKLHEVQKQKTSMEKKKSQESRKEKKLIKEEKALQNEVNMLKSKLQSQNDKKQELEKKIAQLRDTLPFLNEADLRSHYKALENDVQEHHQKLMNEALDQIKEMDDETLFASSDYRPYYEKLKKNEQLKKTRPIQSPPAKRIRDSSTLSNASMSQKDHSKKDQYLSSIVTIDAMDEDDHCGPPITKRKRLNDHECKTIPSSSKLVSQRVSSPEIMDILSANLPSQQSEKRVRKRKGPSKRSKPHAGKKKKKKAPPSQSSQPPLPKTREKKIRASFRSLIKSSQKQTSSQSNKDSDLSVFDF